MSQEARHRDADSDESADSHVSPSISPCLRLAVPCDLRAARQLAKDASRFLAGQGVSSQEQAEWELVLTEAAANAVQNTEAERSIHPIELLLMVHSEEVECHLVDHTLGFSLPSCVELPDDLSESGRGLYVIRSLVDSMDYLLGTESNRMVLVRRRAPRLLSAALAPEERVPPERIVSLIVEHDLQVARSIQRALLPRQIPQLPGVSLAGQCISAREVGGDFFDVLPWGDQGVLLVIADVMGKGIAASILAGMLRSHLHALQEWAIRPGDFLGKVNQRLYPDLAAVEMFITAQLVFVDVAQRRARVASAGHGPVLVFDPGKEEVQEVNAEGLPLGVLAEQAYPHTEFTWPEKGGFLLYTDGITEGRNERKEFFGLNRLKEWCQRHTRGGVAADALVQDLVETLSAFQGSAPLHDDQTFLIQIDHPSRLAA